MRLSKADFVGDRTRDRAGQTEAPRQGRLG